MQKTKAVRRGDVIERGSGSGAAAAYVGVAVVCGGGGYKEIRSIMKHSPACVNTVVACFVCRRVGSVGAWFSDHLRSDQRHLEALCARMCVSMPSHGNSKMDQRRCNYIPSLLVFHLC